MHSPFSVSAIFVARTLDSRIETKTSHQGNQTGIKPVR